jgi:hypothetical protein
VAGAVSSACADDGWGIDRASPGIDSRFRDYFTEITVTEII